MYAFGGMSIVPCISATFVFPADSAFTGQKINKSIAQ